jgi:hypothetical protein
VKDWIQNDFLLSSNYGLELCHAIQYALINGLSISLLISEMNDKVIIVKFNK